MILAFCIAVTIVTLALGGLLTEIGPWYYNLSVPPWKPPNWAFAPIWTSIGVFTVLAANLALHAATGTPRAVLVALFLLNAVLNSLWSLFFFKLRRPDWALVEVAALWLSVLSLVLACWPIRHRAALLLLPYLLWVSIAATLNRAIVRRNGSFARAKALATHGP